MSIFQFGHDVSYPLDQCRAKKFDRQRMTGIGYTRMNIAACSDDALTNERSIQAGILGSKRCSSTEYHLWMLERMIGDAMSIGNEHVRHSQSLAYQGIEL
jgi:hypothetical protein